MNENDIDFRKTRIAPTPSGYLHLGNTFSFAVTAALAQKYNAQILLRIDDLDRERLHKEYVQDIFDTLHFLQIPWHEGPQNYADYAQQYSQVHRLSYYKHALDKLRASNAVFACNCSRNTVLRNSPSGIYPGTCLHKQIPLDTKDVCWRLDTGKAGTLQINTFPGNTTTATLPAAMQYFVVRKKDGHPAYQLASLADDLYFGVDMIVRGSDLWDSTLAQHYLAQALHEKAFEKTCFCHHPLLMEQDGKKLSKSAGATSVQALRKEGKTRDEIFKLTGKMAGLQVPVGNWYELGMQALEQLH